MNNRNSVLDEIFSDKADDIRALYPPQTDNRDNMVQIEQDAIFDCPTRRLLQSGTDNIINNINNINILIIVKIQSDRYTCRADCIF